MTKRKNIDDTLTCLSKEIHQKLKNMCVKDNQKELISKKLITTKNFYEVIHKTLRKKSFFSKIDNSFQKKKIKTDYKKSTQKIRINDQIRKKLLTEFNLVKYSKNRKRVKKSIDNQLDRLMNKNSTKDNSKNSLEGVENHSILNHLKKTKPRKKSSLKIDRIVSLKSDNPNNKVQNIFSKTKLKFLYSALRNLKIKSSKNSKKIYQQKTIKGAIRKNQGQKKLKYKNLSLKSSFREQSHERNQPRNNCRFSLEKSGRFTLDNSGRYTHTNKNFYNKRMRNDKKNSDK